MSTKKPFKTTKARAAFHLLPRRNRVITRFATGTSKLMSTCVDTLHRNKKYKILEGGQIVALRDLKSDKDTVEVPVGTLGGRIDAKRNLSTRGTSWVYEGALVSEKGRVQGSATVDNTLVTDKAVVSGEAAVFGSSLHDRSVVKGSARVSGSHVENRAVVVGTADVIDSDVDGGAFIKNVVVRNDSRISGTVVSKTDASVLNNVTVSERTRVLMKNDANITNSIVSQRWAVVFIDETTVGLKVDKNGETTNIIVPVPETMRELDDVGEQGGTYKAFVGKRLGNGDNPSDVRAEEINVWLSHNPDLRDTMVRVQEEFFPAGMDYHDSVVFQLTQLANRMEKPVYDLGLANMYFRGTTSTYASKRVAEWVSEPHSKEETKSEVRETTEFITNAGLSKIMTATQIANMFEHAGDLIESENRKAAKHRKAQARKGHATPKRSKAA